MPVDRNEFFKQATLRMCSSLDIQTALRNTFEYLREFFPAESAFLEIMDARLGAVRSLARVCPTQGFEPPSKLMPFPEGIWEWVLAKRGPFIVAEDDPSRVIQELAPLVGLKGNSDLVLPLTIADSHTLGVFVLRARGRCRFEAYHLELMATLVEPFTIALANALSHGEMVKYRDLLLDDNQFLAKELRRATSGEIIGAEGGLRSVMGLVEQVAPLQNTVLLLGETGVGKEMVANAIHYSSPRREGPFIKVNCGAIPESLVDAELFGHEKGAFTGATAQKRGRFERACGGTIFLDEIGELQAPAQVRLLRVLQHHEIERVGGSKPISVDIRVIAATHRNLETMVAEGRFREDLWFRLNVFPILIPPLRQRTEDIPALVQHLTQRKSRELGMRIPPPIAPGALDRLQDYSWPGNVRELENVVERELIRNPQGPLSFDSLSGSRRQSHGRQQAAKDPNASLLLDDAISAHIRHVLSITGGKVHGPGGAAELLGVNESTLRARMKKLRVGFGRRFRAK